MRSGTILRLRSYLLAFLILEILAPKSMAISKIAAITITTITTQVSGILVASPYCCKKYRNRVRVRALAGFGIENVGVYVILTIGLWLFLFCGIMWVLGLTKLRRIINRYQARRLIP